MLCTFFKPILQQNKTKTSSNPLFPVLFPGRKRTKRAFSGNMELVFGLVIGRHCRRRVDKIPLSFFSEPEIFGLAPPTEDFRKNPEVGASGSGVVSGKNVIEIQFN
jgi:hypothetical protein